MQHPPELKIGNVSDTARWVAVYRAMETERPDAHFRDPFARRLAGEHGRAIVARMPGGTRMAWPMIVRTQVFDEVILRCVRERGADAVLNLAAGLDARPWRMDLPESLLWVDVDLPGIADYKAEVMRGEAPRCRYESISADLTDAARRDAVLSQAGARAQRVLVVSEGLLVYLSDGEVAALATALHAQPSFRWWLFDLASPRLLTWMQKRWGKQVGGGNAPFRFAPAEGTAWFGRHGWREAEWHSTVDAAFRLRRAPLSLLPWRLLSRISSARRREEFSRFSGQALLERA